MGKHLWIVVVLLAFIVREGFVLAAWCPDPFRGDAGDYLAYALNLPDYFGRGDGPDAYRSPGYPVLLWLSGVSGIYQAQVVLGTLTVAGVYALGRLWMPRAFALLAALWMALQPHHIAATGTVLSEVLFGALIVGSLLSASHAFLRKSVPLGVLAGVLFGAAYLTNPVIAFLPFLLLPMFWRQARKAGVAMALVCVVAIGGWALRDAPGNTRATVNFVQGSFPEYHQAWKWQRLLMHDKYGEIVKETASGSIRPSLERMAKDPAKYLQWYMAKPYLLFDWDIRIGQGGVYSIKYENSPLDRGWLFVVNAFQNGMNPLLFALAFCGIVLAYRGGPQAMVALAVVYLTAVHVVLQAEPRYAIPYRSLEVLLAFSAVAFLCHHAFNARANRGRVGVVNGEGFEGQGAIERT